MLGFKSQLLIISPDHAGEPGGEHGEGPWERLWGRKARVPGRARKTSPPGAQVFSDSRLKQILI